MANPNAPFGLRPARKIDGSAPNYQLVTRRIAYNNNNQIAKGDPVKSLASGYIDVRGTGSDPVAGIFWGCTYLDPGLGYTTWRNAWTAPSLSSTTVVTAYIINDPSMIFQVRAGGSTTPITIADIDANVDVGGTGAPNTAGYSVAYASPTTINTTSTLPFRIVDMGYEVINNDPTTSYDIIDVVFNNADLKNLTGINT